jgi:hypothetical protein
VDSARQLTQHRPIITVHGPAWLLLTENHRDISVQSGGNAQQRRQPHPRSRSALQPGPGQHGQQSFPHLTGDLGQLRTHRLGHGGLIRIDLLSILSVDTHKDLHVAAAIAC